LHYLWSTGATTNTINENPTVTTHYTVTVTSNGCKATAEQWVIVNSDPVIYDTICYGETYTKYNLNVAPDPGDNKYDLPIVRDGCSFTLEVNLFVHGGPSEFKITSGDNAKEYCAGDLFTDYGFYFELHQVGTFRDTIPFISHTGCDSLVIFAITVNPAGESYYRVSVCKGESYSDDNFDLPVQNMLGTFRHVTSWQRTDNGCDTTVYMDITVKPTPIFVISDIIDVGENYTKYNFNIPNVQRDLTARQYIPKSLFLECDSTVILNLRVRNAIDTTLYVGTCHEETKFNIVLLNEIECENPNIYFTGTSIGGVSKLGAEISIEDSCIIYKYATDSETPVIGKDTVTYTINCDGGFISGRLCIVVTNPPQVPAYTKSCEDKKGVITVTALLDGVTYHYALDDGATQTEKIFNNLSDATYTLTVTDPAGCTASTSIEIACECFPPPPAPKLKKKN